ncbi:MAG TPA: anti-sigma factor antagonist [bacterium]|nr:anti-sigma factor antagonist [bacterium]
MGYALYRKGRIVEEHEACTRCKGVGAVRGGTGPAGVMLCPQCGGTGMEPAPLMDSALWPQEDTMAVRADDRLDGKSDAFLQCRYTRRNGASIVRASGEIDLNNVHLVEEMLGRALSDSRTVVVDLAETSYMDSTGLNMLVRVHEQAARRHTTMAVVVTSRSLSRIFSVLSLQNVFRIFQSVDAALQALSHPAGPTRSSPRGPEADISIGGRD